jgi:hypothetical protein
MLKWKSVRNPVGGITGGVGGGVSFPSGGCLSFTDLEKSAFFTKELNV